MAKIIVSDSPHIKGPRTTKGIMIDVIIALIPAFVMGCVFFGVKALFVVALACVTSVLTEFVFLLIQKKKISDILKEFDFTSLVTGMLLGLTLSSEVPFYVPILGSIFAIAVIKMLFGGTGKNIVNPAIAGRIFVFIAFQSVMISGYVLPSINAITSSNQILGGATPLTSMLNGGPNLSNLDLFLGTGVAGCIGETSKAALLLGAIYLVIKRVINWKWPILYIVTTGIMAVILDKFNLSAFLPSILSGGLFLGAIYMATDYVTTPSTDKGCYIYFTALGILTAVLRYATKIEVVSFAILLMNLVMPLLNFRPRAFGEISSWQKFKQKLSHWQSRRAK
ncbi:MAG: RnfABCDGE type electron transport complex subunit D [Clostridiales bacterium]|nr:RnfABCDGE type electron transport complex subunit D [Clostridiales bacterium]